jgi:hypothetical protein
VLTDCDEGDLVLRGHLPSTHALFVVEIKSFFFLVPNMKGGRFPLYYVVKMNVQPDHDKLYVIYLG